MPLIRNGKIVADSYVRVADDAPIPDGVPVIVSASRLLGAAEESLDRGAPTGVVWPNDRRVAELAPYLDRLALIALNFPTFKDGRGYSQARLLRERYGYRGELRATGQILRDQFLFLVRAGFDSLEVVKAVDVEAFAAALARYSVFYQLSEKRRPSAARHRLQRQSARAKGEAVPN